MTSTSSRVKHLTEMILLISDLFIRLRHSEVETILKIEILADGVGGSSTNGQFRFGKF